jgi:RNase P subunit RPR2
MGPPSVFEREFMHSQPTPLLTQVQFMRFCEKCGSEQIFVASWSNEYGLVGCCLGCGDESLVPYSRVNSEAA